MKIGDYVRTKKGEICHIEHNEILKFLSKSNYHKIIKSSPDIIDLIEVGDYVNGHRVIDFMLENNKRKGIIVDANIWGFDIDEIKSIVTKEQFESMEYKIGE